ncbi:MAG: hypothetical protein WAT39_20790 [Planctomycetota bacterium]
MNGLDDVSSAIDHVALVLAQQQIPHAFGGALAQNYWGVVRATQDVDVLAFIPAVRFQQVVDALTAHGFTSRARDGGVSPLEVAVARESQRVRGLFEAWLGIVKVELFSPILPLQHRILERAVQLPWKDRKIPVTTAEDLILLKMVFHRDKDLRDIRAMVATRGESLDRAYMLAQAGTLLDATRIAELRGLLAPTG